MPLTKLQFRPGINREITSYSAEGGWYDCDMVRFVEGYPEAIGGWTRYSTNTFLGTCRSLHQWVTLGGALLLGVGTNLKFYVELGSQYNDITPLRATESLTDPFATTASSTTVVVTDAAGGFSTGDFVTFSGASAVGGLTIDGSYQVTRLTATTYSIEAASAASGTASGGGSVTAAYEIPVGAATAQALTGWGAGGWGLGAWGEGEASVSGLRLWNQSNFGEDLIFGPRGGALYIWDASGGVSNRATRLDAEGGASDVPAEQNMVLVSDVSRFVICFGCTPLGGGSLDTMLIRWSDQEDATNWTPSNVNQAGGIRLSQGSEIITAYQSRQEILVWTDSSLYSMQYTGPGNGVWGAQLLATNTSIISQNAVAYANGVTYWMGNGKFYVYDGTVQTLPCDVREYVFQKLNLNGFDQIVCGTNERFQEIWWHMPVDGSVENNFYLIYNYRDSIWYYGTEGRTAWLDTGLSPFPLAAVGNVIVNHESGVDDEKSDTPAPITSFIESARYDFEDGDKFVFMRRLLPDVRFDGSTAANPAITFTVKPYKTSGADIKPIPSEGATNTRDVVRSVSAPVEQYTEQLNIRVRGRQLAIRLDNNTLGVRWKLGSPQFDIKPDGRK